MKLNNGKEVLQSMQEDSFLKEESFLRMIETENSMCNEINVTDDNIRNNSRFILDLWD